MSLSSPPPPESDREPVTIADTVRQLEAPDAPVSPDVDGEEEEEGRPGRELALADLEPSLLRALVALFDKQGQDLVTFEMRELTPYYDYVILVTGLSPVQREVLQRSVRQELHQLKVHPLSIEGSGESGWILMDYRAFLIHIMAPEKREYYHLETLWGDLPQARPDEASVTAALG